MEGLKAEAGKRLKGDTDAEQAKKKQVQGSCGGGSGCWVCRIVTKTRDRGRVLKDA